TFTLRAGPLPKVNELVFKVVQTYSDGTVVRWIETTPEGGPEPDHPAPVLKVVAGEGETTPTTAASASGSSSDDSDTLAVIALIVGGAGLVVAFVAIAASRRTPRS